MMGTFPLLIAMMEMTVAVPDPRVERKTVTMTVNGRAKARDGRSRTMKIRGLVPEEKMIAGSIKGDWNYNLGLRRWVRRCILIL